MESAKEDTFMTYPEIENHYNKTVKSYIENHTTEEMWVATEKVHGTNFSFIHDGTQLICAKRNSLLKDSDKFFNF